MYIRETDIFMWFIPLPLSVFKFMRVRKFKEKKKQAFCSKARIIVVNCDIHIFFPPV